LAGVGELKLKSGKAAAAFHIFVQAASILEESEAANSKEAAYIRQSLSKVHAARGELNKALVASKQALEIYRKAGMGLSGGASRVLHAIGDLQTEMGQYQEAEATYLEALDIFEETKTATTRRCALVRKSLGFLQCEAGECGQALDELGQALTILRTIGLENTSEAVEILTCKASVLTRQGCTQEALSVLEEVKGVIVASELEQDVGARAALVIAEAEAMRHAGKDGYIEEFARGLSIIEAGAKVDTKEGAELLRLYADALRGSGQSAAALEQLGRAQRILSALALGRTHSAAKVLQALGSAHREQGNFARALELFDECEKLLTEIGLAKTLSAAQLLVKRGKVHHAQRDMEAACRLYQSAVDMHKAMGTSRSVWASKALLSLAAAKQEQGCSEEARACREQAIKALHDGGFQNARDTAQAMRHLRSSFVGVLGTMPPTEVDTIAEGLDF